MSSRARSLSRRSAVGRRWPAATSPRRLRAVADAASERLAAASRSSVPVPGAWLQPTFSPARTTSMCSRRGRRSAVTATRTRSSYRGKRLTVDVGAQFFHPDTHPIYVTLLEQLGLYDPAHPGRRRHARGTRGACASSRRPGARRSSRRRTRSRRRRRALDFVRSQQLARHAVLSDLPWKTTVEAWIRSLSVSQSFKNDIVYPWITALIGSPRTDALRASARSILQTFALAFPAERRAGREHVQLDDRPAGQPATHAGSQPRRRVHLHARRCTALRRGRAGWFVETPTGSRGPYRHVVLNAPPTYGRQLLCALARLRTPRVVAR